MLFEKGSNIFFSLRQRNYYYNDSLLGLSVHSKRNEPTKTSLESGLHGLSKALEEVVKVLIRKVGHGREIYWSFEMKGMHHNHNV